MSHIQRETSCPAQRLNSGLDAELSGHKWARNNVGQSGAAIYRLYGNSDASKRFLKHGKDTVADDFSPDPVVTDGDFSLDNLIFGEGEVIGCIDI